jgi:predicted lactoylglutathione lyase
VGDQRRAVTFHEALGFTFDRHVGDATAAGMLVGEDAFAMLATREPAAMPA